MNPRITRPFTRTAAKAPTGAIPVSLEGGMEFLGIGLLAAIGEVGLRRFATVAGTGKRGRSRLQPTMTAQRAQQLFERVIYLIAPAAVAGAIALTRYDADFLALLVLRVDARHQHRALAGHGRRFT